jgi:hypothetical protein
MKLLDLYFLVGLTAGISGILYYFLPKGTALYFNAPAEQITPITEEWITAVAAGDFLFCYLCILGLSTGSQEWRGKIALGLGIFGIFHFSAFYYMTNVLPKFPYLASVAISVFIVLWYLSVGRTKGPAQKP